MNACVFTGERRGGASAESDDHPAGHVVVHRLVPHLGNKQNKQDQKTDTGTDRKNNTDTNTAQRI